MMAQRNAHVVMVFFGRWLWHLARQERKNGACEKATSAHTRSATASAWCAWANASRRIATSHRAYLSTLHRRRAAAFRTWAAERMDALRLSKPLLEALSRRQCVALEVSWHSWCIRAAHEWRTAERARCVERHSIQRAKQRALTSWRDAARDSSAQLCVHVRAEQRLTCTRLSHALSSWVAAAARLEDSHVLQSAAMAHARHCRLVSGWVAVLDMLASEQRRPRPC